MAITKYRNTEQKIIRNRKYRETSDAFFNTMTDYAVENMDYLMLSAKSYNLSDLEDTVMSLGYV